MFFLLKNTFYTSNKKYVLYKSIENVSKNNTNIYKEYNLRNIRNLRI